jgi:hypothetical protein
MQDLIQRMTTMMTETTKNLQDQLQLTFEIAIQDLSNEERQFVLDTVTGHQSQNYPVALLLLKAKMPAKCLKACFTLM